VVERAHGQRLTIGAIFARPTIEGMAQALRTRGGSSRSPLVPIQPLGTKPPIFAVHAVFGDVLCYQHLARHLGPDQPLFGVEAHGLTGERAPLESIEEMAKEYVLAIRAARARGPYVLSGYSFGGYVALEMARQLTAAGEEVEPLVVLGTPPPSSLASPLNEEAMKAYNRALAGALETGGRMTIAELRAVHDDWILDFLADRLGFADGRVLEADDLQRMEIHLANMRAGWKHRVVSYPGKLVVFQTSDILLLRLPEPKWESVCERLEIVPVPGTHRTLLDEPYVEAVAKQLSRVLARG